MAYLINMTRIKILPFAYHLLFILVLLLSGCVTPAEKEQMQMDIANIKRELEAHGKNLNAVSENIRKDRADILASMDKIKEEMAFLSGRFEESKFEAQKAKEALETVQAKTIDQKEVTAKFSAIQTSVAAMEKQLASESERIKNIEEKVASVEKDLQEQKDELGRVSKKDVKEEEKEEEVTEPPKPEALYAEGFQKIKDKDFTGATETFKKFINLFPNHDLADNAQYWIGEAYFGLARGYANQGQADKATGALEQAVQEFRKVIVNYPRGEKVPTALYKEALALLELKQPSLAEARLKYLLEHFPQSEEAPLARDRLASLKKE